VFELVQTHSFIFHHIFEVFKPKYAKYARNGRILLINNHLAGLVAQNWNTIYPSLVNTYDKLVGLDLKLEK